MSRVQYVPALNAYYQNRGLPPYKWSVFETSPWASLSKPLEQCRIAILSSGGISLKGQPPFDPLARDEFSWREIPKDARAEDFVINYAYNDHSDADKDINCIFPVARFRELEEEGYIGELAPVNFTMGMGRLYRRTHLQTVVVPEIVRRLRAENVDALFLVPS